ncbi:MAG: hypothetical protein ACK4K9_06260 [Bacteroidia bacterium]
MSKQLLNHLNGNRFGKLKQFINNCNREPRIAWYPSAGEDLRGMRFLHPNFFKAYPASENDPAPPDIFIYTDYFPWEQSTFLDSKLIYAGNSTYIHIEHIEELPRLNLKPLHYELVDFPQGSIATDRTIYLELMIDDFELGKMYFKIIYAFAENETFFCKKMLPNNANISHVIHVRYGGGGGGGGKTWGAWLMHALKLVKCEVYITDNHRPWLPADDFVLNNCKEIPKTADVQLKSIRKMDKEKWNACNDVDWNLVV